MKLDVQMRMRLKAEDRLFQLDVAFQSAKDLIVIFGPSGAGKSVTFQAIAGLIKPERGRIVLDGRVLFDSIRGSESPGTRAQRRLRVPRLCFISSPHRRAKRRIPVAALFMGR